jgi:CubicO group peptidase (beta-lactamase class C family)
LAVLTGVGATGSVEPSLAQRAPNGGWRVSAADYIKVLRYFDGASSLLGPATRQWLRAPEGGRYSLGAGLRRTRLGLRLAHSGKVHHDRAHPARGGSYFIVDPSGYAIVVIFSGTNPPPVYKALAEALNAALDGGPGATPRASAAAQGAGDESGE